MADSTKKPNPDAAKPQPEKTAAAAPTGSHGGSLTSARRRARQRAQIRQQQRPWR